MANNTSISPLAKLNEIFATLESNFQRYDELNDSIRKPSPRSTWVELFKKRAQIINKMYDENNRCIEQCHKLDKRYHAQSIKDYNDKLTLKDLPALSQHNLHFAFYHHIANYLNSRGIEIPFTVEEGLRTFEADMERLMPHSEITLSLYASLMRMHYQIAQVGDIKSEREAIRYALKTLSFESGYEHFGNDSLRIFYLSAYHILLDVNFICRGIITPDEAIGYWEHFQQFVTKHPIENLSPHLQPILMRIEHYVENFILIYAILYHNTHDDKVHEEWLQKELNNYIEHYTPDARTYQRYAIAMTLVGRWSHDEAIDHVQKYQNKIAEKIPEKPSIEDVLTVLYATQESIYLFEGSHLCIEEKQEYVNQGYEILLKQIRNCTNKQLNYELSNALCNFVCDPKINQYLNTKQRAHILGGTLRSTLVQTYAHCNMVARISEEILDAIMRYQPELLVGYMGIGSKDEVLGQAYNLNRYIIFAALFHDIGKLSMIQVVHNDYCTLMDHEFEILKRHPENGLRFLELDPSFAVFHDVVLGHHKWYDGIGGYPASFNNTHSPYRIFIDIISIADCMEAATDNLGRNYSKKKDFSDLFEEMSALAGTRYNPDIIRLIRSKSDVFHNLSELVHVGWEYNYYDVYLDYFGKR